MDITHGFDMLDNDNVLGNFEVKIPSPFSSSADRSINEDEEPRPKSGSSSSACSSPSNLRERLRHFSSPNQTPQLSSRVIGRRFPQKHTNIIEEVEEREQQPSSTSVEEKGARARRRARLQAMVAPNTAETIGLDSRSTSTDDQTSNRSSMLENRSPQPEERCSLMETLSARTFPSLTPYRSKRNSSDRDTSRSLQNPPFCESSSKIDLQPLSPLDHARPKRFGGYRPQTGVILQNLSSGSEAEYSHETVYIQKIDHLMPAQPTVSPHRLPPLSSRSSISKNEDQGWNDRLTPLSSSRTVHDSTFYRVVSPSRNWRDAFGGKVGLEPLSAKLNIEEPRNLECVKNESQEETHRSEGCIDFSMWRETLENPPDQEDKVEDKQFTNVPTLALNSQEISSVATPAARVSSRRCLDTDALMAALSNVSLKQQTKGTLTNECSDSSENNCPTNRSQFNESEMSYESSGSRKSKIPVRVPSNKINPSEAVCQDALSSSEEHSEKSDTCRRSLSKEGQMESARTESNSRTLESSAGTCKDQNPESGNSGKSSPELKVDRSENCMTPLEIGSDDDRPEEAQSDTYRVNSNLRDSYESLVKSETTENLKEEEQKVDQWKSGLEDLQSPTEEFEEKQRESKIGDVAETSLDSSSSEDPDEIHQSKVRFSMEKLAAEELRKSIYPEQTKTLTFFMDKMYKPTQHSSTSKLQGYERARESPRFRKSQDRFPFTISEKTSVSSIRFKHPGRTSLDKKSPDRTYHLEHHPSITRLAGSGFEETPADIIDYVTRSERVDHDIKAYGMKGLVQRVSARLRRSKKDKINPDTTSVIYKNSDYREEYDSLAASCSESSLVKELRIEGIGESKGNPDSPDEKSSVVSDNKTERPYRRYDRDDLWVRTFDKSKQTSSTEAKDPNDRESARDYSVFFVKSARENAPTDEIPVSMERKERVKFRGTSLAEIPKMSDENVARNKKFERIKRNVGKGCFCLKFYRMIVPVSFRHRSRYSRPLVKKKSRFPL